MIERTLPTKRFIHTLGVVETAERLAIRYDVDVEKARLAAMLHDYAKYVDRDVMRQLVLDEQLDETLLAFDDELLHAPVGAVLLQRDYSLDEDVLSAIRNHTTGAPGMSRLDQVVFVADAIEPNRSYPGVETLRASQTSHSMRCRRDARHTMTYLLNKAVQIFPLTEAHITIL